MSALTKTCTDTAFSTSATKTSPVMGLFMGLLHEIRIRRALREVSSLDESALVDMGLNRGGIEDAVRCGRR